MSAKPEQTSRHSSPYHALSVVQRSCQKMRLTWDISSHSAKVEALVNMEQVIARAIAELVANSEQQS